MVVSTRGASGGFRYWFGDRVGVNFTAGWYPNGGRNTTASQNGSSAIVLPSVMVMLTEPNETRQIDVRPYIGAGVNYSRAYGPTQTTGATSGFARRSGTGGQAFAGAEVTFREMDMITLSVEGIYYILPTSYVNSSSGTGFNYVFAVHFYLK